MKTKERLNINPLEYLRRLHYGYAEKLYLELEGEREQAQFARWQSLGENPNQGEVERWAKQEKEIANAAAEEFLESEWVDVEDIGTKEKEEYWNTMEDTLKDARGEDIHINDLVRVIREDATQRGVGVGEEVYVGSTLEGDLIVTREKYGNDYRYCWPHRVEIITCTNEN